MAGGDLPRYDRDFLLGPAKRNQIVELWKVEKFERDSFGDPNAVALYGMAPAQWYARGVRMLARTALEAVRDPIRLVGTQDLRRGRGHRGAWCAARNEALGDLTRVRLRFGAADPSHRGP